MDTELKIDIGCGTSKQEGFIGLDYMDLPGVDHVLDLTADPLPFADNSVSEVFSAHFLEHIHAPNHIFSEIGRVCKDGAKIEFLTPYAFSNEAFIYGHVTFLTEEPWMHFCCIHPDHHAAMLQGRWLLHNINYTLAQDTYREITQAGFSIAFAIKYFKSVVLEFGVTVEYQSNLETPAISPKKTYSFSRQGERFALQDSN